MKSSFYIFFLTISFFSFRCARISSPTGGPVDTNAPVLVKIFPNHLTTNFKGNQITIQFNEYINVKDPQSQLIISPTPEKKTKVSPLNTATKKINLQFLEPLKENTTYNISFGNCIQDYNEGNILKGFNFVFSTGKHIDSLAIKGKIINEYSESPLKNTSVFLYKNRSINLNELPDYYSNSGNINTFSIQNLPQGTYNIVAINDINQNLKYDAETEEIGFLTNPITLDKNTEIQDIKLFKSTPIDKIHPPTQVKKNKIILGYQGKNKPLININGLNNNDYIITKIPLKDSLQICLRKELDKIDLNISQNNTSKSYNIFPKKLPVDSLKINIEQFKYLNKNNPIQISFNNPIITNNLTLIEVMDFNKNKIPFEFKYNEEDATGIINFEKIPGKNYQLIIPKNTFIDFLGNSNPSLEYRFSIYRNEELSNIVLDINNKSKQNLIIDLLDTKSNLLQSKKSTNNQETIQFSDLVPNQYKIRIIIDENKNNLYDTGDFENKKQPEKVIYLQKIITLRMNSEIHENINID